MAELIHGVKCVEDKHHPWVGEEIYTLQPHAWVGRIKRVFLEIEKAEHGFIEVLFNNGQELRMKFGPKENKFVLLKDKECSV